MMNDDINKRKLPFWIYIAVIIILACIALKLAYSYFSVNNSYVGKSGSTNGISSQHYDSSKDVEEYKEVSNPLYPLSMCPFNITETYTDIDSAGGVDLILYYENNATNEIKYVYLYATPYNRVGDIEASEIGGKTTATCRLIGPFKKGYRNDATFENVWYNYSISSVRIEKIEIEYMNGRTHVYQ